LKNRPVGVPQASDFELAQVPIREPEAGEVLVRNIYMSVDPYMRGRMVERKSYVSP
jgi:NADPH-dependent curcumin reductase CurA